MIICKLQIALTASGLLHSCSVPDVIQNDSYFYGQSPPVYPTPQVSGLGDWATSYAKASAFVAQLSLEEKSNLTFGVTSTTNGCTGNIPAIARLDFPGMCLQDAGNGVRATDFVNAYASGISVGASWNKDLTHDRGMYMGGEFRAKGVNVALGPVVGPLGRIAEGGRNWEGFSNDPYLGGALAAEHIRGTQSTGVITSIKHYIGNEQELNRNPTLNADNEPVQSVSSNIDDKTLHELYLWPFADAIHAGSGNVMCSYNRINNSYACQNSKALNGILKEELGFQGFVVSDWWAQHAGVASTLGGLDLAMPNSIFWGANMIEAINNGSVPESRLTNMATRIIAAWYQMGQDSAEYPAPGIGMPFDTSAPHQAVIAKDPAAKSTILQGAIEGHVLVKNTNNALPLKSPKLLSLFGYDGAAPAAVDAKAGYNIWSLGYESSPDALLALLEPTKVPLPQIARHGTIISAGGSGANSPAYVSDPFSALAVQAYNDNTNLLWDFTNTHSTADVDAASDACLVFINAFATEGIDRPGLHDDYSDALVLNIAAQCANTIVVIHNAGVRLVDQWIEHDNVTAVIFAHLPGQDSGRALVEILYGRSPPSGKLPYTVAMNESQYGALLAPTQPSGDYLLFPQDDFSEGVLIDYRAFDAVNATPRYEFGFGLSYTTFSYGNLGINLLSNVSTAMYPVGAIVPGGAEDLWDVIATVTADVTNRGSVNGTEVAQLYVGIPGGPVKQLRGFNKVDITPGESVGVEFDLLRRDLSVWDTVAQKWALQTGDYAIYVGASSRILPLEGMLTI